LDDVLQSRHDRVAREDEIHLNKLTAATSVIHDREGPKPSSIEDRVCCTIHTPAFVQRARLRRDCPHVTCLFPPARQLHREPFFPIDPMPRFVFAIQPSRRSMT
jgi:hypothetical protein